MLQQGWQTLKTISVKEANLLSMYYDYNYVKNIKKGQIYRIETESRSVVASEIYHQQCWGNFSRCYKCSKTEFGNGDTTL